MSVPLVVTLWAEPIWNIQHWDGLLDGVGGETQLSRQVALQGCVHSGARPLAGHAAGERAGVSAAPPTLPWGPGFLGIGQ